MDDTPSAQTSPTLLGRLRQQPSDQAAWELFIEFSRESHDSAEDGATPPAIAATNRL
jgi:hypothetical protein